MQTDGSLVKSSRAQMKIQQMAFMLIAVVVFFAMVGLIYLSISLRGLENSAEELRDKESQEIARQLSGTPEFSLTSGSDCAACLDFDKALALSQSDDYTQKFWNLDYLMIEKIYPPSANQITCTANNYPDCSRIILIDRLPSGTGLSGTKTAFVALARWDADLGELRYELGRIHALIKNPEE